MATEAGSFEITDGSCRAADDDRVRAVEAKPGTGEDIGVRFCLEVWIWIFRRLQAI